MIIDFMNQGGPIMWIIAVSGVLAAIVFVERSLHLHRARIKSDDFLQGIVNNVRRGNIREATTICDETPGPVAYVVKTAIILRQEEKEVIREAVNEAGLEEISRMERRLVVVATVGQIAPLLGLLGTVLGLFDGLLVMQRETPLIHSPDLLFSLRQALSTTAAGLMVAIPCYAAFNLLVVKIDRIVLDMERAGREIVAFLKREDKGEDGEQRDVQS